MKPYLSVLFFSVLLNTVASLECETCIGVGKHCSGSWQTCRYGQDTCATVLTDATVEGTTVTSIAKGCSTRDSCNQGGNNNILGTAVVTKVECSKAAVSSGSFFLSLLSLLVVKMLL